MNESKFQLAARQKQIVAILAEEGLSSREIAARLGIGTQRVKQHISAALWKLGVKNRVQLAMLWKTELFQLGLSA